MPKNAKDKITVTKGKAYCSLKWKFHHANQLSTMYQEIYPQRKEESYFFYYLDRDEFKRIHAKSETDAINQAVKIIRKKLYKEADKLMVTANALLQLENVHE